MSKVLLAALLALTLSLIGCNDRAPSESQAPAAPRVQSTNTFGKVDLQTRTLIYPVDESNASHQTGEAAQATRDVSFDDLKIDIEKGGLFVPEMITPEIDELIGRRIRIRGFMFPTFQQQGISQFVLLQQKDCPFGTPEGYVHHAIYVKLKEGQSARYSTDPMTVEGMLSLDPKKSSRLGREFHIAIYRFDDAEVR